VDVVQDDHVPVRDGAGAVVDDVAENDAVLGGRHLHVSLDAENEI